MKFTVSAQVTISIYTEVEASSAKEAEEIALARDMCSLTDPQRHGESADEVWFHSGEIDGEAQIFWIKEEK